MTELMYRIEDVDFQVGQVRRLIQVAAGLDVELASGLGSTEELSSVQKRIDYAAAACEDVDRLVRQFSR